MRSIWEDYYAKLTVFVSLSLGRGTSLLAEDSEDVVQEIMIKILSNLHRYDRRYSLGTWIYSIARNHCRDALRKQLVRSRHMAGVLIDDPPSRAAGPEEELMRKEQESIVGRYLDSLGDGSQQVAFLRFTERMSYDEIGQVLETPAGTVKYRVHEIRKGLRNALEEGT